MLDSCQLTLAFITSIYLNKSLKLSEESLPLPSVAATAVFVSTLQKKNVGTSGKEKIK